MRLIDADEFIKEMNNRCESAIAWVINAIVDHNEEIETRAEQAVATFCEASLTAKKMPTIESDPVKHGRWMGTVCSACGESFSEYYDCNYCPNCGARMDGETNETD